MKPTAKNVMHVYEVRSRKDKRGFDLLSDALSIQPPPAWLAGGSQM